MLRNLKRVVDVFKSSTKRTQPSDFLGLPAELRVKIYTETIPAPRKCTVEEFWKNDLFWDEDSDSSDSSGDLNPAYAAVRRFEHFCGLHALRLTCRHVKDELDYEIVRRVLLQVNDLLRDLDDPVGRLHEISLHTSWVDRSLSRTISEPRAFKDIQNLRITGRLQDLYKVTGFRHISHGRNLLHDLSPLIRSLTFDLMGDQYFSVFPSAHMREQFMVYMDLLVLCMRKFMLERAYCASSTQSGHHHLLPRSGVREIRINIPPIFYISDADSRDWRAPRSRDECGLNFRHETNVWGHLTFIAITRTSGDSSCFAEQSVKSESRVPRWRHALIGF